jgi:hypothetical protein
MSSRHSDDEFERRIRDVLHNRSLDVPVASDSLDRIHHGALRRHQRRVVASGTAAFMIVAAAGIAVAARGADSRATHTVAAKTPIKLASTPAQTRAPAPASAASAASTAASVATPDPSSTAGFPSTGSPQSTSALLSAAVAIPAGGSPPVGFVPLSVTAISAKTYWVLGHAPCASGTCTAVVKTTDGGASFTEIGAPSSALVPDAAGTGNVVDASTISDIRFVDSSDGWAYGGGLWQTTDGGQTWTAVGGLGGSVQRLAVASGQVWAIVRSGATASTGPSYALYASSYPNGAWARVGSAGSFGPAVPALAVHNTAVTVIGDDAATGAAKAVTATGGTTFTALPAPPCVGGGGNPVSETTTGGLWLACSSIAGKLGGVVYSPDFGASFSVISKGTKTAILAIGAVDDSSAIVGEGEQLVRMTAGKSTSAVAQPAVKVDGGWAFIGFTDTSDGFAIPIENGTRQLWRTTDGGSRWSVVAF